MKVKDLMPIIHSDFEIVTEGKNSNVTTIADALPLTSYVEEAEIINLTADVDFSGNEIFYITVKYDDKLFMKEKEIKKLPKMVWVIVVDDDVPSLFYFEQTAKEAFIEIVKEHYETDFYSPIDDMTDDEIWEQKDSFDWLYARQLYIAK